MASDAGADGQPGPVSDLPHADGWVFETLDAYLAHLEELGTIVTAKVDEVWGTDMTQTITTQQGRANVFVIVDHCSGEFIATHASLSVS